jgi:hypothetical protein
MYRLTQRVEPYFIYPFVYIHNGMAPLKKIENENFFVVGRNALLVLVTKPNKDYLILTEKKCTNANGSERSFLYSMVEKSAF